MVADQIGAPTPARLIATLSLLALRARLAGQLPGGVYHLATRGETSWHGFACEIFAQARARGVPLALADDQAVGAIATADYRRQPGVRSIRAWRSTSWSARSVCVCRTGARSWR